MKTTNWDPMRSNEDGIEKYHIQVEERESCHSGNIDHLVLNTRVLLI